MRALLATLVCLAGCYDPKFDPDEGEFLCDSECPSGYTCVGGLCQVVGEVDYCLSEPAFRFVIPEDGATVTADVEMSVEAQIENFRIAEGGEHWHSILDDMTYVTRFQDTFTAAFSPGFHDLEGELVQANHAPLTCAGTSDAVTFYSNDGKSPHVRITAPEDGEVIVAGIDGGAAVTVEIDVRNFVLDGPGPATQPTAWVLLVDGERVGVPHMDDAPVSAMLSGDPGSYELTVQIGGMSGKDGDLDVVAESDSVTVVVTE